MTFDFLKQISIRVYERYLTLEKNIKSASNSFYDAYLDLQEELLRHIISDFGIEIITRKSFGELLKLKEVSSVFLEELSLNQYTYEKMQDYSLKVNSHKHKGEKKIEIETVLKYLNIFYEVSSTYAKYKNVQCNAFDREYFEENFDFFEKENLYLKNQLENYRDIVEESNLNYAEKEKYRLLLSYSEINSVTLEEQNKELRKRLDELSVLKSHIDSRFDKIDERLNRIEYSSNVKNQNITRPLSKSEIIMINSKKDYIFCGTEESFFKWKIALTISFLVLFTVGIFASYFATKYFELYSTYTLFENIYMYLTIFMFAYVLKSKMIYNVEKYKKNSFEKLYLDSYGRPFMKKVKTKYYVFLILSLISSIAHFFLATYDSTGIKEYITSLALSEALFFIISIAYFVAVKIFFNNYFAILHTVKTTNGVTERYVDDGISGTLRPYTQN